MGARGHTAIDVGPALVVERPEDQGDGGGGGDCVGDRDLGSGFGAEGRAPAADGVEGDDHRWLGGPEFGLGPEFVATQSARPLLS